MATSEKIINLENLIKGYMADIAKLREEIKVHSDAIKGTVEQDKDYSEVAEKVNAIKKEQNKIKKALEEMDALVAQKMKLIDLKKDLKEMSDAMSDYLNEYSVLTNSTEFVGPDGDVFKILRTAKLAKQK
jgi:predicted  nucleic acid-binding Zn-ribbon protein